MTNPKDCLVASASVATCECSKRGPARAEPSDAGGSVDTAGTGSPPPKPRTIRGPEPRPTLPSHSILIPHRGRQKYLDLCLWSIHRSAAACGSPEYETIVTEPIDPDTVFNKSALHNIAVVDARGDVLSFVDADMLVGERWMEGVGKLVEDPRIVRLCYRVRRLSRGRTEELFGMRGDSEGRPVVRELDQYRDEAAISLLRRNAFIKILFDLYDHFELAAEAYRAPDRCDRAQEALTHKHLVYGNSQFSITREKLADIRYDERYEGKGREDWEIARQMQRRYGDDYRGFIWTDADHAMFHIWHDHDDCWETWANPKFAKRQWDLWEKDK